jgi:hypothetical protein
MPRESPWILGVISQAPGTLSSRISISLATFFVAVGKVWRETLGHRIGIGVRYLTRFILIRFADISTTRREDSDVVCGGGPGVFGFGGNGFV